MKTLWKIEDVQSPLTDPYYNLIMHNKDIYYAFREYDAEVKNIGILKINSLTGEYIQIVKLVLSNEHFNEYFNNIYYSMCLFINNNDIIICAVNRTNGSRKYLNVSNDDVAIMSDEYEKSIKNKDMLPFAEHYSTYNSENFKIRRATTFIEYYDEKSNNVLWKYFFPKLKKGSYEPGPRTERLCTEIVCKKDLLIFGTSAAGWLFSDFNFHCIELSTGIEKVEKIQVAEGCHTWYNDTLFARSLESNLLQLNFADDINIQQINFKEGKLSGDSPITVFNNKICTLVKNDNEKLTIVCAKK